MDSKINISNTGNELEESNKTSSLKTLFSYGSIIIGIIGLGLFFSPVSEIICGVGGLILSIMGKDKNATWFTDAVRKYGNYAAWLNIIWVCLEFGLKFAGIDLFGMGGGSSMDLLD